MKSKHKAGRSLSEVHASVDVASKKSFWKKILAFFGPAYLISVGYMDPGNWATDIAGGSRYGYSLIWVLLMSNLMALLLQGLSARLGLVRGRDLAQSSRETYSRWVNIFLYVMAEIAIAACDLAEVIGMAIGLQLLFHIPLLWGVSITVLDTFLLLFLLRYGIRILEAFILSLVVIIGMAFLAEMFLAKPDFVELSLGFIPSIADNTALYIAIGIIGATVMPHNLYLHSALVQTRKIESNPAGVKRAIRFNLADTAIALNLAFFVNAAILVLAASTFYKYGLFDVSELQDAHKFLAPLLGSTWASVLFAVALIAAGQSSTITGTLAGQVVMEGYLNIRIKPWIRRLITRFIAIIPAYLTLLILGEGATGKLLILSQVILSLQLGFAVIPLIHFVSDKKKMGEFAIKRTVKILAWLTAAIIVGLNVKLVFQEIISWLDIVSMPFLIWITIIPVSLAACVLLLFITFVPFVQQRKMLKAKLPHGQARNLDSLFTLSYKRIAITIDFSNLDTPTIRHAIAQGGKEAEYRLIHVVESVGAIIMEQEIDDYETETDKENLEKYCKMLQNEGYKAECVLGFGNPKKSIPILVRNFNADLLVMGAHGHKLWKDILLGTTLEFVRHKVNIPVLIVSNK